MPAAGSELLPNLPPVYRVAFRWTVIGVLTLVAFWPSFDSLMEETFSGAIVGYVLAIPFLTLVAAQGVARRRDAELPIHDRQTDLIVGFMGMVLALLVKGVLLERYADQYHLLRLDMLAMWLFVVSASVTMFGLRPVARFAWVWLLLLAAFPIGFRILVISLGGTRYAAGFVMVLLAAAATALAVGRTRRRGFVGAAATAVLGSAIVLGMMLLFPDARVIAYELIPSLTATSVVCSVMYLSSRRGETKAPFNGPINSLSAKTIQLAGALVLVFAVLLALISPPTSSAPPVYREDALEFGTPLIAPTGWQTTDTSEFDFVKRFFGRDSTLIRQYMTAEEGNPAWDKLSRPRTVVVDSVTSPSPVSFTVYPDSVIYDMKAVRTSEGREVDLGNGVVGEMFTVIDDTLHVTWTKLTWTWRNKSQAQRVTLLTVDNHDPGAPFPEPEDALVSNLNTVFMVLIRGNSVATDDDPDFKDAGLLTVFGRDLVATQLAAATESS
ncbi:hypothetical protein [Nocardia sp. 348MFTsu5.1]|uniref:hypothetical protein n=1 Tax=Nocardia sp. 348MFTsu5.1 TaxID=1172185 RepID=UPI00036959A0|nr:hypothetical protein [Nocardia sp. 348MFTsu5.1]